MRLTTSVALSAFGASISLPAAYAWGAAGHEIVATIAQMYLHPKVLLTLCGILDLPSHKCHIASVATWADQHRNQMRWSASLHYVGALDDHPSQTCAFPGERHWAGTKGINVLDGIKNTTSLLQGWVDEEVNDAVANEALKFLIHFVGDMQQPLHLTGRDRGGNSIKVLFDRRHTNLHSVWDTSLIAKAVRTVPPEYSHPLPYRRIEAALRGTIYDSYIRRILAEGVLSSWKDELPSWLACPATLEPEIEPHTLTSGIDAGLLGFWYSAYTTTLKSLQTIMDAVNPKIGVEISPDGPVVCPYFWAQPNHKLNCEIIWPRELDEPPFDVRFDSASGSAEDDHTHGDMHHLDIEEPYDVDNLSDKDPLQEVPLLQLDTPKYSGEIAKRMLVEKLLAQGGIRLAGILNYLFAPQEEGERVAFVVGL